MSMRWLFISIGVVLVPSILLADAPRLVLAEGEGAQGPKQPQVSVSANGIVDLVYVLGGDIQLTTSRDRGASFLPASGVIRRPNIAAGRRRGPRVVRTKSAVIVTAIAGKQGKGRDGELWAWRSADEGATWSEPVRVNDAADSAREGLHGMTLVSQGEIACVWLDLRGGKMEVYSARSSDDGRTWGKNIRVYRSPGGSVCECCHPSIIGGPNGSMQVMFRNSLNGQRDMFLATSGHGQEYVAARKLGQGTWKLNACPMDGGMLASDGQQGLVTVWQRENRVFATSGSEPAERELGPGQQPWVAWSASGPIFVWTQGREGALSLLVGLNGMVRQLAPRAGSPVIAANSQCELAVACWEVKQGERTTVVAQAIATAANSPARP